MAVVELDGEPGRRTVALLRAEGRHRWSAAQAVLALARERLR